MLLTEIFGTNTTLFGSIMNFQARMVLVLPKCHAQRQKQGLVWPLNRK